MICDKCGKEIIDGEKFCQDCGTPIGAIVNKKLSRMKKVGIIAIGVLIFVLVNKIITLEKRITNIQTEWDEFYTALYAERHGGSSSHGLSISDGYYRKHFKKDY